MAQGAPAEVVPTRRSGFSVEPRERSLPVRLDPQDDRASGDGTSGGADHVGHGEERVDNDGALSDAGWVIPPGGTRVDAAFSLVGTSLGISRSGRPAAPVWLDLYDLVGLDAIGDPVDDVHHVEISMADGSVIGAGWSSQFCDAVVRTLQRTATEARPEVTDPAGAAATPQAPTPDTVPAPATNPALDDASNTQRAGSGAQVHMEQVASVEPVAPAAQPAPEQVVAPEPAGVDELDVTAGATTLELEDVVYLGGYPGQSRRRKRCTVSMSRTGLELSGPSDRVLQIAWTEVMTIEVQNADEARFRMNTKIHRDASALVIECEQGVTVLLEARDCPTIALRSAITQLLTDLPVVVV